MVRRIAVAVLLCLVAGPAFAGPELDATLDVKKIKTLRRYKLTVRIGGEDAVWTVDVPDSLVDGTPTPDPKPDPTPDPPPEPDPNPNPDPEPEPDLPVGQFAIAKDVRDWANAIDSPTRKADAEGIAKALQSVQSDLEAARITTIGKMNTALQAALALHVPKERLPAWKTQFVAKVYARAAELHKAGRLGDTANWAKLFGEIVVGLKAVK